METHCMDAVNTGPGLSETGRRIDLHCHSVHSRDSNMSVSHLVETATKRGLWGLALTDHDSVEGHKELLECDSKLVLIPGCEVTSIEGHILAYGVVDAPAPHLPLVETIANIIEQGGVPVLAHPFRPGNGVGKRAVCSSPKIAVEGVNGRSWQRYNLRATALGRQLGRCLTGGSDAHTRSEVGMAWTMFPPGVKGIQEALEAIRRGEVMPGGKGLPLIDLVRSKAQGTRRWIVRRFREKKGVPAVDSMVKTSGRLNR